MASWSLILAALVVGITICVAIGYIVFLQPNPESNVPDLPPSDAVVETPPDETSSTSLSLSPSSKPENASEATYPSPTFDDSSTARLQSLAVRVAPAPNNLMASSLVQCLDRTAKYRLYNLLYMLKFKLLAIKI